MQGFGIKQSSIAIKIEMSHKHQLYTLSTCLLCTNIHYFNKMIFFYVVHTRTIFFFPSISQCWWCLVCNCVNKSFLLFLLSIFVPVIFHSVMFVRYIEPIRKRRREVYAVLLLMPSLNNSLAFFCSPFCSDETNSYKLIALWRLLLKLLTMLVAA